MSTHQRRESSCQACIEKAVCVTEGVTLLSWKGGEGQPEKSKRPHPAMFEQTQQTLK